MQTTENAAMPKRKPIIMTLESEKPRKTYIHMKIAVEEKQHYVGMAKQAGVTLTDWIRLMLKGAEQAGVKVADKAPQSGVQIDLPGTAATQSTNEGQPNS